MAKTRLDTYLTQARFAPSRNKSAELIKNGFVRVNSEIINKPSFLIESLESARDSRESQKDLPRDSREFLCDSRHDSRESKKDSPRDSPNFNPRIEILKNDIFVSRAGEKLDCFVRGQNLRFDNLCVLDIGASKGGFAQVLLKYGAKRVVCVDVGSNQLDLILRQDSRVEVHENCDIRDFVVREKFDFVVCDVSFTSLKNILKHISRLAKSHAIVLFKPQFEVGRCVKRDKTGVVKDKGAIMRSLEDFKAILEAEKFRILSLETSQIRGKEGNEETFIYIQKQ